MKMRKYLVMATLVLSTCVGYPAYSGNLVKSAIVYHGLLDNGTEATNTIVNQSECPTGDDLEEALRLLVEQELRNHVILKDVHAYCINLNKALNRDLLDEGA